MKQVKLYPPKALLWQGALPGPKARMGALPYGALSQSELRRLVIEMID